MNRFQRYLADEFAEDYEEGRLTRRQALHLIASVTGSVLLANTILAACAPPAQTPEATPQETEPPQAGDTQPAASPSSTATEQPAASETPQPTSEPTDPAPPPDPPPHGTVSPDDPAVSASWVEVPAEGASLQAYLARPADGGPRPVVLVCHENRGLTGHIQDVARRLARAGYVALAVDLLSRLGGTEAVGNANVPGALGGIDPEQFAADFISGWRFLGEQPFAQAERVGMTGFCFGGGVTWLVATRMPELLAAVPYYGPHPPASEVPSIAAPVLAIYAERDQRINQGIPAIEAAMQEHNKVYEKVVYPEADHAFLNDTGSRYNPEAAQDAWRRTLAWFGRYL